jgi:hypothetical protein
MIFLHVVIHLYYRSLMFFFFHVILVSFLIIVVKYRYIGYWGNDNVHDEYDIDHVEFDEDIQYFTRSLLFHIGYGEIESDVRGGGGGGHN